MAKGFQRKKFSKRGDNRPDRGEILEMPYYSPRVRHHTPDKRSWERVDGTGARKPWG